MAFGWISHHHCPGRERLALRHFTAGIGVEPTLRVASTNVASGRGSGPTGPLDAHRPAKSKGLPFGWSYRESALRVPEYAMLDVLDLDFRFRATQAGRLPDPAGPMARGAFGFALKRLVCVMRGRPCSGCSLERACIYPSVFAPAPPSDTKVMRLYEKAPPPFVMQVPEGAGRVAVGGMLSLRLVLIGAAEKAAPFAVLALGEAASRGFGKDRLTFELVDILTREGSPAVDVNGRLTAKSRTIETPPSPQSPVTVRFLSAVRLQSDGSLMTAERFAPAPFLMAAVRRIGLLAEFYGRPLVADFRTLKERAQEVTLLDADLKWSDATRYSSRQKQRLQVGGLVGRVKLDLATAQELWPYLHAVTVVAIGKATSMGLGAIEVTAEDR